MKKLGNTLFITTPDAYLALNGETVMIYQNQNLIKQLPLHNIENIVTFGYSGTSPAFMGYCANQSINITFLSNHGRFLARVSGKLHGNVLLRKQQYRISDNENESLKIAKNIVIAKLFNSKWVLERACRNNGLTLDVKRLKSASKEISKTLNLIECSKTLDELRGYEGKAATYYFSVFDELILKQKEDFTFVIRNRRPPLDEVNALLSFIYTLLTNDIVSALETVGLDSYVGFMHQDRPGRASLALDMVEELRSVIADRFVLTLINKKIVKKSDFEYLENGAVYLKDEPRKNVLISWQKKKNEQIKHPFLNEKIEWGLVPFVQAQLLARYLRGDIDAYPPFLWK